jgi:hypothetical protein
MSLVTAPRERTVFALHRDIMSLSHPQYLLPAFFYTFQVLYLQLIIHAAIVISKIAPFLIADRVSYKIPNCAPQIHAYYISCKDSDLVLYNKRFVGLRSYMSFTARYTANTTPLRARTSIQDVLIS